MNITINPGAATEDAVQIDSIINSISDSLQTLDAAIKRNIPSGVETTWSDEVRNKCESYYTGDVPAAIEGMKASASNLRLAVEQALAYSQEQ